MFRVRRGKRKRKRKGEEHECEKGGKLTVLGAAAGARQSGYFLSPGIKGMGNDIIIKDCSNARQ